MGRRRKVLLDEDDSDASQSEIDDDFDDAGDLDNPHGRKRRKTNQESRTDWTKAPSFVTGDKPTIVKMDTMENDENDGDESDDSSEPNESDENSDSARIEPSPGPPDTAGNSYDEEEPMPSFSRTGGIGSRSGLGASSFARAGLGAARTATSSAFAKGADLSSSDPPIEGLSSQPSRGGIGSGQSASSAMDVDEYPSSFSSTKAQSFQRPFLAPKERSHFNSLSGSFGARMLAKMGWESGTGLGVSGEGIVAPVETKMRPQKMGIAFKGFKEKTDQSKMEARRRGETVSDDEDERTKKARKQHQKAKEKQSDLWKRPKKVKTQVVHKTYDQYLAEAGEDTSNLSGLGQIIDATGATPKEVSSLADISLDPWASSTDSTRIPEIRHNIKLINESCKSEIDGLAREARDINEKKKYLATEDSRLRKRVEDEAELIARLQQVQIVTTEISAKSKELMFPKEFERYRLDEIVVAAITPLLRRMVQTWNPLEDAYAFVSTFRGWKGALRLNASEDTSASQIATPRFKRREKPMSPFESLLWNVWLPRVRTCINNDWSPADSQPAIRLYEAWSTFLPPFIRDNLLDQLIIPKVQKAVADWTPKHQDTLQSLVFPWLPHMGPRLEEFVGDARRKIKVQLRGWSIEEDIPADLLSWKEVFDRGDWDSMLLKYVVPKLGATLRADFRVNPRDQVMTPLERVLAWAPILSPTIMSQILETEFFHKWLETLYVWLIQPRVGYEEIAQWYQYWSQEVFSETVRRYPGVERGFTRGQQLINEALSLGPDAASKLARPDYKAELSRPSSPSSRVGGTNGTPATGAGSRKSAISQEITFKSLVEEYAASKDLFFIAAGQAHSRSRLPMFRVSKTVDGKGGVLVYILDDAVWASKEGVGGSEEEFFAISLEDMVNRAGA
ncbi:GC-rich sequence DNA-binding factor-like protein-domain-containing protein [Flagelloscypha sp. PMI_526]|nr:GC-rich sequence DNA-binding factor-like protein-domain-containing protein [Flagelloscypha sp. PMI_526]